MTQMSNLQIFCVGFILSLSFSSILNAADGVNVDFVCANGITEWETSVYITGNTDKLGNWKTKKAVLLSNKNGKIYPTWVGTVKDLPAHTEIQWKCIKCKQVSNTDQRCSGNGVVWQPGENNRFSTPAPGCTELQTGGWNYHQ